MAGLIYEVSRFGYQTDESGKIEPRWQQVFVGAETPENAKVKALPEMDAQRGFIPMELVMAEVAKCLVHRRYQAKRRPTRQCGTCHAMWKTAQEYAASGQSNG